MAAAGLQRLLSGLSPALARLLDPQAGPLAEPIRSEIFGPQRFAQHGRSLALTHRAELPRMRSATFFPRLQDNIRMLHQAQAVIGSQAAAGFDISPASQWLLDNFHLIDAQLLAIHEGLPRSYFRALPVLQDEPLAGLPRVYGVCWAFVAHTDGAFDEGLLVHFLAAYQEQRPLSMGEMWALPTTLRVVLIENLRRMAERLATQKAARQLADLVCQRLPAASVEQLEGLRERLAQRGVAASFLSQLALRLLEGGVETHGEGAAPVCAWLRAALPDLARLQLQEAVEQTADNLSVSNAVTSLRLIGDADWPELIAGTSGLMQLLLAAPWFAADHSSTRDTTLHAIERLAKRSQRSEIEVAQALLERMQAATDADATRTEADPATPNYWLRGPGQTELAQALGLHEAPWRAWLAAHRHHALPLYLGALLLLTLALLNRALPHAAWLALLLGLVPASEAAAALINRVLGESMRPRLLPRLALAGGIPPTQRVLVVIPAMLIDAAGNQRLVHRLHLHWLANPEPQAQFALLTDWTDAPTEHTSGDSSLLADMQARIEALNAGLDACPQDLPDPAAAATAPPTTTTADENTVAAPRFILLHRQRRFSVGEDAWIGWERKRGKLEELLAALVAGDASAFADLGPASTLMPGTVQVLTLDSDTRLPPGRLRELVGVAAHPDNRPRLNPEGTRVVRGYGILQPRIVVPLPGTHEDSWFHRLFAGQGGIDAYSAASSEVYQDLFDEGSFSGKGLLQVQAVHAVLAHRLPPDTVLSHDLLEGSLARCGAVTDLMLMEDAPGHAEVAASRLHRWTRGDWQLLPFLLRPKDWPLGAVNRWKLFDNLRRSLLTPASLALLLWSLLDSGVSPWHVLALVFAAFSAGPLMGALVGLVPGRPAAAKLHFYRQGGLELGRAAGAGLWQLAMLLQQAGAALDAIARALWRMRVSRRLRLQWTTADRAQAAARPDLAWALRQHIRVPVAALVLLTLLLLAGTPHPLLTALLCLVWAGGPVWSWWASRTLEPPAQNAVQREDRLFLRAVARDTWSFFERCVTAADHHLPPDNLQTVPHSMLARRTSPTNIGLYLLSVACARAFGWIDTLQLLTRLENTLSSVERLKRQRGHLLNWYDTGTAEPLLPMYVSTVDSGNLSGHLLAVAQACLALAQGHPSTTDEATRLRLRDVARRCQQLAWQPDFGFLYHPRRHLLHIGWRVAEQQLDPGFYDLLASESRLTSLLAIAKGDVPVRHWAALGRPFYAVGAAAGLRSWSGSMFEYLMPTLVLAEPQGSVLAEACAAALVEQRSYARSHDVPWGISESAYAGCDHTLAYQYAPQGVPRLALRRTPLGEMVVAPYASALAAQIAPRAASLNLATLQGLGARGSLGFIEALDFSPARQTGGARMTPVRTFMAHHQGMTLVALANVLLDGVAQRWGMADPHLEAVGSLLHERAPREISRLNGPPPQLPAAQSYDRGPALLRPLVPGQLTVEPTQLLSNAHYSVSLRANGAGTSRVGGADIQRWRDDALRDAWGQFMYLRRSDRAPLFSLTQHPAPDPAARYGCVFHADRVCFEADWDDLQARITVWVSPEDDIEFRQVELLNLSDDAIDLELVSAFELSLTEARADEAHPAFVNFFVSAHAQPQQRALRFERRPRLTGEPGLMAAHFLAEAGPQLVGLRCQTDRRRWLGRSRDASSPLGDLVDWPQGPEETVLDTGLDPVCALGLRLHLQPQRRATFTFATAASAQGATLQAVIDKYLQHSHLARASLMSSTLAGIRMHDLRLSAENLAAIQTLTTPLVLSLARVVVLNTAPAHCDRRLLWRYGISGDRPLILVSISTPSGLSLVQVLAQALRLWSWGGVACDLVVVNAEPTSYLMALQRDLFALRDRLDADAPARAGAAEVRLHVLRSDDLAPEALSTLHALARARLGADGRPLSHHVREWTGRHDTLRAARLALGPAMAIGLGGGLRVLPEDAPEVSGAAHESPVAHAAAGFEPGRFDAGNGEFRYEVRGARRPARPWVNVLANPDFGGLVSESGPGTTWAVNSRLNQLTPWSNDAVADQPGEWLLLQDRRTREVWSLAPSAFGDPALNYRVRHGQGSTTITHRRGDIEVTACWCVDPKTAVKQLRLRFVNHGIRLRSLRLVGLVEWLLGSARSDRRSVHTALHTPRAGSGFTALMATQPEASAGFGGGTAFWAFCGGQRDEPVDWTCDRREVFDTRGRPVLPDRLGQRAGGLGEPCAMLSVRMALVPGAMSERVFLLGWAPSAEAAAELVEAAAQVPALERLLDARRIWDRLLGATSVVTPDPLFDALVNRWLLYQTVSCRLWAKAGFYQAGGATGFRDQLQDTLALSWAAPEMLREQILRCASRQFAEGDVQHWWHAPLGVGVRTRFSDDLLWLPYAVVHCLRTSADPDLLDQSVPFIEGQVIADGAEDSYGQPQVSMQQASIYEHAARAIDRSLGVGVHGLPLMGSGDWNDGMNRVGIEGRGESVWLAWFLCRLVADFAPIARQRGDLLRAQRWEQAATGWQTALQGPAWDGRWYQRAFFDDGQPLGSHVNAEARIDLIAQAWAVLSGGAPADRQAQAMAAVESELVDADAGLIRLLTPPFVNADPSPGYIQAYPPGVRENGGQYSHAGVWALMAQLALAKTQADPGPGLARAWDWFRHLSPAHRAAQPAQAVAYEIEPYVMAGDVYSAPPWTGRGGWSWYTGSAAWMHRAAIESIFGLQIDASCLRFEPGLPPHWPRAELTLRRNGRILRFLLLRCTPELALATAAPWYARATPSVLLPGATLAWPALGAEACFVMPLLPAEALLSAPDRGLQMLAPAVAIDPAASPAAASPSPSTEPDLPPTAPARSPA
jgi:cyclic beta-1,2-glucan synthetase